jgi:ribosomal protein S18 acetylase RimI-like enzyme
MRSNSSLPQYEIGVTYLEMTQNPHIEDFDFSDYKLKLQDNPDYRTYINTYREVGKNYIWNYRPPQSQEEITNLIQAPHCAIYYLYKNNEIIGMAECDISDPKNIEIVHFGLIPQYIEKGLGKKFFNKLLSILWNSRTDRIFLSTCDWDYKHAISFYQSFGFKVFKETTAIFYDYRYTDFYALSDAPQIPLAEQGK